MEFAGHSSPQGKEGSDKNRERCHRASECHCPQGRPQFGSRQPRKAAHRLCLDAAGAKALRFRLAGGSAPLEELVIRHALGEDVSGARLEGPASGVMMVPIPKDGIYESV